MNRKILKNILYIIIGYLSSTFFSLWLFDINWPEATIILTYLLSVFVVSLVVEGFIYGFIASIGSVGLFNFLFTEPRFSLNVDSVEYWYTFAIMLMVSIITSFLAQKITKETKIADEKEARINVLIEVSREFFQALNLDEAVNNMINGLSKNLNQDVYVAIKSIDTQQMQFYPEDNEKHSNLVFIERCYQQSELLKKQLSDKSTDYYFPIRSKTGSIGVLWLNHQSLDNSQIELIEACCSQLALAEDRQHWIEKQQESLMEIERERLRVQLLSAISHDLRTPLSGIIGTVQTIRDNRSSIDNELLESLLKNVYNDSTWLLESVENILSLMRLQDQTAPMNIQLCLVEEIIEEVVSMFANVRTHTLDVIMPERALMIEVDSNLIVKVLVNLIQNAIKYAPEHTTITINVHEKNKKVYFEVSDVGPGLSDSEKLRVFNQFYSIKSKSKVHRQGLGLGLSICKTIIEAHQGSIRVVNNDPQGARFIFSLQVKEPVYEQDFDY